MEPPKCDKERNKTDPIRLKKMQSYGWPLLNDIPETAYLVFGSNPFEPRKGRTFYDDPAYYQLDIVDPPKGSSEDTSRYFKADLLNRGVGTHFKILYCNTFDTIIFDNSVVKMLNGPVGSLAYMVVEILLHTLKPGGTLIVDSDKPGGYVYHNENLVMKGWRGNIEITPEKAEAMRDKQNRDFLKQFDQVGPYEIKTYDELTADKRIAGELIAENPIAKAVYKPLIDAGPVAAAGAGGGDRWEVRKDFKALVFTKPALAGGKRKTRRRRRSRRRRHN